MPKYQVQGKGNESARSRTRTYTAKDEISARQMAEADGTAIESVEELPPEPPTERQIAYANDLGINIPAEATKEELSDLISCKVDADSRASPQLRRLADEYGVETTRYSGKGSIYGQIFRVLSASGREHDMAAWFTFNVLKDRSDSQSTAVDSPNDPRLAAIASKLTSDSKAMQSIKRYSESTLLWFGERTDHEGYIQQGGSNRTAAYKVAAALVDAEFGLKPTATASARKSSPTNNAQKPMAPAEKSGLSVAQIAIIVIVVLIVLGAMF